MITQKALVLNATYEAIALVPMKRAIILVLQDKAEILHEGEELWRSANLSFRVPTVVKLTYFVKIPYRARIPLNRQAVLTRDNHECQYCAKKGDTIDHVVPRSRGGKHEWSNVVACCRRCNAKKDDRTLRELGWTLRRQPATPTGTFWLVIGIRSLEDDWLPYLGMEVAA